MLLIQLAADVMGGQWRMVQGLVPLHQCGKHAGGPQFQASDKPSSGHYSQLGHEPADRGSPSLAPPLCN